MVISHAHSKRVTRKGVDDGWMELHIDEWNHGWMKTLQMDVLLMDGLMDECIGGGGVCVFWFCCSETEEEAERGGGGEEGGMGECANGARRRSAGSGGGGAGRWQDHLHHLPCSIISHRPPPSRHHLARLRPRRQAPSLFLLVPSGGAGWFRCQARFSIHQHPGSSSLLPLSATRLLENVLLLGSRPRVAGALKFAYSCTKFVGSIHLVSYPFFALLCFALLSLSPSLSFDWVVEHNTKLWNDNNYNSIAISWGLEYDPSRPCWVSPKSIRHKIHWNDTCDNQCELPHPANLLLRPVVRGGGAERRAQIFLANSSKKFCSIFLAQNVSWVVVMNSVNKRRKYTIFFTVQARALAYLTCS